MSKKILIVDDEIELCDMIAFQLTEEGYEVSQAYSTHEAFGIYESFQPDIILSDMRMPGGTGVDLYIDLKEKHSNFNARFYIVSGFISMNEVDLLKMGISGVIKKPMRFTEILDSLKQIPSAKA